MLTVLRFNNDMYLKHYLTGNEIRLDTYLQIVVLGFTHHLALKICKRIISLIPPPCLDSWV